MKNPVYPVFFEDHSFLNLKSFLKKFENHKIIVLVDENTIEHCFPKISTILNDYDPEIIEIQSGELHKNLQTCQVVWNRLLTLQAGRKSLFVNLGGGVITDLGGFVASVFKRGIPFIHIPTTLLASVDAAVGGKTGIDYRAYKNQLGVFSYPQAIFINTDFFSSLNIRQLKSGYAEMIKHSLIADENYWNKLSEHTAFPDLEWKSLIDESIRIKTEIVEQDPEETGLRKLLNFGHTIGHALESFSLLHHNIPLMHGEAVALGIIVEADISVKKLGLKKEQADSIKKVIEEIYPIYKFFEADIEELTELMIQDKKNTEEGINFTLIHKIGKGVIDQICTIDEVKQCLFDFIQQHN